MIDPAHDVMLSPREWQEPNVKHKIGKVRDGIAFALCGFESGYPEEHARLVPEESAEEYRWCGNCSRMLRVELEENHTLYDYE